MWTVSLGSRVLVIPEELTSVAQHIADKAEAPQLFWASVVTGLVTIAVALIGVWATGRRPPPVVPPYPDNDEDEVTDLKRQRDAVQTKLDYANSERDRLSRICVEHGISPYTGERVGHE